jgi:hypothetical protein
VPLVITSSLEKNSFNIVTSTQRITTKIGVPF